MIQRVRINVVKKESKARDRLVLARQNLVHKQAAKSKNPDLDPSAIHNAQLRIKNAELGVKDARDKLTQSQYTGTPTV